MVRDIYPAEVYETGKGVMTRVRAFVTTRRLIVWGLDRTGAMEKKLEVELAEPPGAFASKAVDAKDHIEVATLTRGFIINRGRGCGCGSPLKALGVPVPWGA